MEKTPVEWLVEQMIERKYFAKDVPLSYTTLEHLVNPAKQMEKDRETRIKELETFLQEDILDDVYYYHSPIWYRATELLNKDKDEQTKIQSDY